MRRIRTVFSVLAIASASWFIATPSRADQPSSQQPPTTAMTEKISTTATVVKVDAQKRDLTLRGDDGTEFTVKVPESMKLGQIHEGDRVKIDYYEAVGLSLKKGEAGAPPRADESTITEHKAGTLPGGMVAHRITATVDVVKVDRAHNKLTVKRPGGAIDTINVTEPAMQAQLANLHEGDRIQATYTEAAAITVMRERAMRPQSR
jgi:Cu/Ag efflux protein CusF